MELGDVRLSVLVVQEGFFVAGWSELLLTVEISVVEQLISIIDD